MRTSRTCPGQAGLHTAGPKPVCTATGHRIEPTLANAVRRPAGGPRVVMSSHASPASRTAAYPPAAGASAAQCSIPRRRRGREHARSACASITRELTPKSSETHPASQSHHVTIPG
jgi:hypothetical protein